MLKQLLVYKLRIISSRKWNLLRMKAKMALGRPICYVLGHAEDEIGISICTRSIIRFCPRCYSSFKVRSFAAKA